MSLNAEIMCKECVVREASSEVVTQCSKEALEGMKAADGTLVEVAILGVPEFRD